MVTSATAQQQLSDRKAAILRALVQQYIRSGEPVGSEAVTQASGLGVSSATVRNELSALEEMGYLVQPHTSAGRVPTDLAYRYFVNMLPAKPKLRDPERRAIVEFFDAALADVDEILRGTTHLLSRLTRYASLALAPSPREMRIARAQLVRLGTATLLLLVFDTGQVEKRLIDVPAETTEEELERATSLMAERFQGKSLDEARAAADELATKRDERQPRIFRGISTALGSIAEAAEAEHVFLGGVANLATEEAFHQRDTIRRMYEALERESAVLRLLREAASSPPVGVTIGHENSLPEMWEASVVAAPYAAGGGAVGTIGIVGPTRMDYAAAISAVRAVADRLSAAVEALSR